MAYATIALLISLATGYAVLGGLAPNGQKTSSGAVFRLALAGGLGLFVSSLSYLLCLSIGIADRFWVIGFDLAILAGAATLARRRSLGRGTSMEVDPRTHVAARRFGGTDWLFAFGLVSGLIVNAWGWIIRFADRPLGFWDAFAIWNLKARFFFVESGAHWLRAFSETISWSHTDYPLLLPLSVARLWTYAGEGDQAIPVLLAAFFAVLIGNLLFGAVALARGRTMGFLTVFALLATPSFMGQVVWQLADIPMSYFLAAALALIVAARRTGEGESGLLVLAGLLAGTAAWTKNEGLLFALAIASGLILADVAQAFRPGQQDQTLDEQREGRLFYASLRSVSSFSLGLALPLAVLLTMKLCVGGANDLATDLTFDSLARIFVFARHEEIFVSFARTLLTLTGLPLLGLVMGLGVWAMLGRRTRENAPLVPALIAILLQLSGYYFVYLVTERDLAWHLDTSNLRLFVQLWPSALLLIFLATPPPVGAGKEPGLEE